MNAPTPQELVEHALSASTADHCIVVVTPGVAANLRWANNTLTTNGVSHSQQVSVISFRGAGNASVTSMASSADQVAALVESADRAAADADPAEDAGALVEGAAGPDWDEPPGETSIGVFSDFARDLGDVFGDVAAQKRLLYGFVFHEVATTYVGSSTGLRLRHEQPTGHYGCTGKPADLSASAWVGGAVRDFEQLRAADLSAELSRRLAWADRRVDLPAGRYDTVLPPTAVADLMVYAYWTAGARLAHDGQTVFSKSGGGTRIGERVARPGTRLYSDPSYPSRQAAPFVVATSSGPQSSVYDTGIPLGATRWIDDGTLTALVQTRQSADVTGQPVTPEVDNLVLEVDGATGDEMALVDEVDDGLLLTCLWYIREVDPQTLLLTGLTRDGVYRVEHGEITGAVNNFRFNESPVDLLRRYRAASATVPSFSREWGEDDFSRTAMPSLRIPDFNMSSVSQAL